MKAATRRDAAWERGIWPFLAIFLTTTLLMPGCASQTVQPVAHGQAAESQVPYRLPPGTKVALTEGRFNRPVTVKHGAPGSPYPKRSYHSDRNSSDSSMCWVGYGWLPLMALGLVGCAAELLSSKEPAKPAQVEVEEEPRKLTILRDVPTEDASKERKASDGKSDSPPSSPQRQLAERAFATSIASLRSLPDRVRSYGRERGLGDLNEPPGQAPELPPDQHKGREAPDYVIELGIAGVEMHSTHYGELYWFGVIGGGRLIRVKDNSVVQAFVTEANTNPYPWTPEDVKQLSEELDFALNTLAQRIVDEWLEPVIKGQR